MPDRLTLYLALQLTAKLDQVVLELKRQKILPDMNDAKELGIGFNKVMVFFE